MIYDLVALLVVLGLLGASAYISSKGDEGDFRRIRDKYEVPQEQKGLFVEVISITRWRGPRFFLNYNGSYLRKYYIVELRKDDGSVSRREVSVDLSMFRPGDIREI
jgi:hypothetical protein